MGRWSRSAARRHGRPAADRGHRLRAGQAGLRPRPESPAKLFARLAGSGRRGHGLSVVRRVAASHHGSVRSAPLGARLGRDPRTAAGRRQRGMSRRGRALVFLAPGDRGGRRGGGDRRRIRIEGRRAATDRCARSWSLDSSLRRGRRLDSARAGEVLTVRRVPERFVPPGALAAPAEAAGLVAAAALPAGSYLQASQLRAAGGRAPRRARRSAAAGDRSRSRSAAADALLLGGASPAGAKVDVVVTTEPTRRRHRAHLRRRAPGAACSRSAPAPKAPNRAELGRRDPRPDQAPGPAADRRRELCPRVTLLPAGGRLRSRERHRRASSPPRCARG